MRFNDLDAWLAWQETLNPKEIDLGLDRVARVLFNANLNHHFDCPLIMVAGTNGKGSVVAMIESIALAAGLRVACYTSPHIDRYNERIRINGHDIDDDSLCQAFERIDAARNDVLLTYFEFGTLAAIDIFSRKPLDLVVMEIGLGGRLDAVNVMHPSVSVITTIAIDHTDWLGMDRETIAREKAGIMRTGVPVVCVDPEPPAMIENHAQTVSARLHQLGRDFFINAGDHDWQLTSALARLNALPRPALAGEFQLTNAAGAIMALQLLAPELAVEPAAVIEGLASVQLRGHFEQLQLQPLVIADVAHNAQAIQALLDYLESQPVAGNTHLVIAMLADKRIDDVVSLLNPAVDVWYSAGLEQVARGSRAPQMAASIERLGADVKLTACSTVTEACAAAMKQAGPEDRIVITGSFYTVAEARKYFAETIRA